MDMRKTVTIVAVMVAVAVIGNIPTTEARPSYSDGWADYNRQYPIEQRRTVTECDSDSVVRNLCQRCAKVTKSRLAYPLCCEIQDNNIDGTRNWCDKFVNFGRTNHKSNPA